MDGEQNGATQTQRQEAQQEAQQQAQGTQPGTLLSRMFSICPPFLQLLDRSISSLL